MRKEQKAPQVCSKWVHLGQWGCLGKKERKETLGVQGFLLQVFLEKRASQDPQGDQDHLVPQVPQEELLKVTFLIQVHLETGDLLALMAQEEYLGLRVPLGMLTF